MPSFKNSVIYIQNQYWKTLGIKPISNKAVSVDPDNRSLLLLHDKELGRRNYTLMKYLPRDLRLEHDYRKGIADSYTQTNQIKNFHELLFMYMAHLGLSMSIYTHWYKLLITADNRAYQYHGRLYVDGSGQLAYRNYSKVLKKFKKHVMNTRAGKRNQTVVHALRLRNQVYSQLHVHGLVSSHGTDCRKMSSRWGQWLTDKLGYTVKVSVVPLRDYKLGTNTAIVTSDNQSQLPVIATANIQQWLKYINRSRTLAFPNSQHPERLIAKWQHMSLRQRKTYVVDSIINHRGVTCNLNYSYTRKMKSMESAIKAQERADRAERQHKSAVDRWVGHKHLTSTEQWITAQGKSISVSSKPTEQMSLDVGTSEPAVRQRSGAVSPNTVIIALRAVLDNLLVFIHNQSETVLEIISRSGKQTYILIYEDGSRIINHSGVPP